MRRETSPYIYELIGQLAREGVIDLKLVINALQYLVVSDWETFAPLQKHLNEAYKVKVNPWWNFEWLAQEAVKHMKRRRSGCIINIGSVNAYIGLRRLVAYAASKGGLMTFSRNLANSLTRYRIRVNLINPGWVFTEGEDHMESVEEGRGKNWTKAVLKTRPFGRMLTPADIARAALFFARNELMSGAVLDYEQMPIGTLPEP